MKKRVEVAKRDQWDLCPLFESLDVWEKAFEDFSQKEKAFAKLGRQDLGSAQKLRDFLGRYFGTMREVEKFLTYAHLRNDEDIGYTPAKQALSRALGLYHIFAEKTAWVEPEILLLDEIILKDEAVQEYAVYLQKIVDRRPHTLDAESEALLASAGQALETAGKAFTALNNADMKFRSIKDGRGKEHEVSHGCYSVYMISPDRVLRQGAFESLHEQFLHHENTCAELINGVVQKHLFYARARGFKGCLDAALFPNQIDVQVYRTLVEAARKGVPALQRYFKKRKERLELDDLRAYDLYVPLVRGVELQYSYDEAVEMVIESVAPLGSEYQQTLQKGLKEQGWVDRYENQGKKSGAYSSGCYDSFPYILMNFTGTIRDVATLTHEAGHSMHSYYSHHHQPYHYASYSIFVAEVASTLNEELLFHYMLEKEQNEEKRQYLICSKLDDMRSTFFRQTLFAEFELTLHEMAERSEPITPDSMKKVYRQLNEQYYGSDLMCDHYLDAECMRIPHFYYNFYVYQYATGISAAFALCDQVLKQGKNENVLKFLSSGSSLYPLDVLKLAGVDMRDSGPVNAFVKRFEELLAQIT